MLIDIKMQKRTSMSVKSELYIYTDDEKMQHTTEKEIFREHFPTPLGPCV